MRALVLVVLLLAGCAQHPADAFAGINTREDLLARMMGNEGENLPAPLRQCIHREVLKLTPPPVLAAMDRFLADKSQVNWDAYVAADRAQPTQGGPAVVQSVREKCKDAA